jgi:hypothetical protein
MDEESKNVILARRARFIAAALASVAAHSQACDANSTAQPCLTFSSGGTETGGTSGAGQGGSAGASVIPPGLGGEGGEGEAGAPQVCLSVE